MLNKSFKGIGSGFTDTYLRYYSYSLFHLVSATCSNQKQPIRLAVWGRDRFPNGSSIDRERLDSKRGERKGEEDITVRKKRTLLSGDTGVGTLISTYLDSFSDYKFIKWLNFPHYFLGTSFLICRMSVIRIVYFF